MSKNKYKYFWVIGGGILQIPLIHEVKKLNYSVIGYKKSRSKRKNSFPIFIKKKIENFIKNCDIIVSILPYTKETKSFIDKKFLNKMKKKSLLINIGRGASLNEKDLLNHLKQNKQFFASLDVFTLKAIIIARMRLKIRKIINLCLVLLICMSQAHF